MAPANSQNHYEVLRVPRQADHDQIRRAYLKAARQWHPDRYNDKPAAEAQEAERTMRLVNEAWTVLGDKSSRDAYDRQLVPGRSGARVAGVRTDEGVTRIDPRLLDPQFLAARRQAFAAKLAGEIGLALDKGHLDVSACQKVSKQRAGGPATRDNGRTAHLPLLRRSSSK